MLQPSIYSNQIVAHVLEEPHPTADQVSSETIVISPHPRPAFVDWTSSSSSSYVVPAITGLNRPAPASARTKGPNITKHVLFEVAAPIKRSKVNDSDRFYNLKVTDLQKGPFLGFKSDEERDRMLLASH